MTNQAIADSEENGEVIASCAEVSANRLGKFYRRTDKRAQAQEHLTTAKTMYREMRMTYWLEKVEKELEQSA